MKLGRFGIMLVLLSSSFGCVATNDTVGLRIFHPSPRFTDDNTLIDLIDPVTDEPVVVGLRPGGHWRPAEVHGLKAGKSLVLRVKYQGADVTDYHLTNRSSDFNIDMNRDYDVTIHWEPAMSRPPDVESAPDGFDWGPHWARQPAFELTPGHPDLF